ncbi:sulfite exporter TauE/SafE family protein [Loktanella sp. Alg231-35]|uniref:sulfite exporter TauE/SafE family protein n=1 Tax=Loktanella sp. Alg231-35 TaxID=1922220 RepID=UPI001F1F2C56|nr:sulfite exporter TauE/SafE family protein [Loktanella sp. Alg231-35]
MSYVNSRWHVQMNDVRQDMPEFPLIITPAIFVFACAVTLCGGFVKGAVGFAMPLIMISGMGILIPPELVVAGLVIPIVIANGVQVGRAGLGHARAALSEHWRYVLVVCIMILVAAQFVRSIPTDTMFIVLGVSVVGLCAIQLIGWRPLIPPAMRTPFEWIAGALAGTLGGLSGTWGPPTVLYLLALRTPREQQMSVQGVIYGLGSVMLLVGHVQSGILNAQTWGFSAALVLPSLLGMWLGFRWGARFDQERFRKITLWVLIIAGTNLIRRGIMG